MMKFEAQILSKEIIKPSSPEIHNKEPFKLCVFDQLTPTTYVPIIVFYAQSVTNTTNILTQLKKSLSETLNIVYPFSGRTFSNMFIHDSTPVFRLYRLESVVDYPSFSGIINLRP
ncbi:hypothetical protein J1N35_039719 [Gossypium stocksii]|uniref:Uncharacterized protein n=1 Tax=Gossypium stocksii TaxID=47602 RepID=A0A9D3ZHP4_9ROSI|nr:hypothetical protein J1N35_039719 [Gossypium stocksii]